jgi:NTE family protein
VNRPLYILLAIVLICSQTIVKSQSAEERKVGLVLSGGGAKGLAHIGALKVIDSLGIKVDYVAGTSMGAIIGGLYAAGYTGKQLDSIFNTLNFDELIQDDIPRSAKTYYERRDNEKYAITLPFKDFQVRLPSSLSKGQNFYNLISRLLSPVKDVNEFEKLPIPFFCIATNILTGEEVVLDSGYLPRAINASSALPSLLAPVEIDKKLLTDGGVVDNYPVEKLREKGMDIIIGVDVQDDLRTREELGDALDVLSQINNFRTIQAMETKSKATDIYIQPDITRFTVTSFDQGDEIIASGKNATVAKIADLQVLSSTYQKKKMNLPEDRIWIDHVEINGNDSYSRAYILGRFKLKTPGYSSYDEINFGINNLQATRNFDKINYNIVEIGEQRLLKIEVTESDVRNNLRLGVHYDDLLRSAAIVNLSRKNVLFGGDIVSGDVILGDNPRYVFDYYIDKGRYWSIGLRSDYVRFRENVEASLVQELTPLQLTGVSSIQLEYREFTHQVYVQTQLDNNLNLSIGGQIKVQDIFTETLTTNNPQRRSTNFINGTTGIITGKVMYDSYDKLYFPTEGWKIDGSFDFFGFDTEQGSDFNQFSMAQLHVGKAYSFGQLSLRARADVGITIGDLDNTAFSFLLGGYGNRPINNITAFYSMDYLTVSGDAMIRTLFEIDYEVFKKTHVMFSANFASVEDNLFESSDWFSKAQFTGYAIGLGAETFLGPISLRYSFTPQDREPILFVNVGYRF